MCGVMGFGKDGRGAIVHEFRSQAVGTLANNTGLFLGTKLAITKDFRMLKSSINAILTAVTAAEMDAGMEMWLVDGDLTLGEAVAKIESQGPLEPYDRIGEEVAERYVKFVGAFGGGEGVGQERRMVNEAGGYPKEMKPRWTFGETKSWQWMLYNRGAAPTTGALWRVQAVHYGVWLH